MYYFNILIINAQILYCFAWGPQSEGINDARLYPSKPFSPESGKAINARIARASVLLDLEASIKSFNINLNHYRNLCFLDGDEFGIGKKKIFLFYLL